MSTPETRKIELIEEAAQSFSGRRRAGDDDLFQALWKGRLWILRGALLGAFIAIAYAFWATPVYRAEAILQVRNDNGPTGGLGALASQFGGLASLAGISLGGGAAADDRAVVVATLKSRALVQSFITEDGLMPKLYPRAWDAAAGKWKTQNPEEIPTLWDAYTLFLKKNLSVTDNPKTGLITVAIEWKSPREAASWVTELVARTNALTRRKAIEEGEKNLAYLQQQAKDNPAVTIQQAVYNMVELETKKLMLAKGNEDYSLITIDAAQPPSRRIWPMRALIVVIGTMIGIFLGVIVVSIRGSFKSPSTATS